MPHLYGKKVMLREYRDSDFEHIRAWVNNPKITRNLSDIFLYPHSAGQTRRFMERASSGELKGFVIARADTGEYLGQIDFTRLDLKNGCGELGMVIGSEADHGKGYGTEALGLFLDFAFFELRLNRVELLCWPFNTRARRLYEKMGFVLEGVRRQKRFRGGTYHDELCYGLLKEEWEQRRRQQPQSDT